MNVYFQLNYTIVCYYDVGNRYVVCEIIMQLNLSSIGDKTNEMIDAINK